jgi:hypothetical protein
LGEFIAYLRETTAITVGLKGFNDALSNSGNHLVDFGVAR